MTTVHTTDDEIQEYVLNNVFDVTITEHIKNCRRCSEKASQYKALFKAIKQQDAPVFDFNVTPLVIKQLMVQTKKQSTDRYLAYGGNIAAVMLSILFYVIKTSLPDSFNGLTPSFIGLIVITALVISFLAYIDMYRKFKAKMNILSFY